jgi:hypothetical protein
LAVFLRSLQPAAANDTVCSQPHPSLHHRNPASSLILQHIDAKLSAGDSSAGRKRGAAIAGARRTGFADDQIHILGVATFSRRSPFRRWLQPDADFTRGLQPSLSDGAVGRRGSGVAP